MTDIKAETTALAALFQCATQIQRIATTGYYDEHAVACVLRSLLVTDPQTVDDIYAQRELSVGFRQIVDSFGKDPSTKTAGCISITKMALKVISLTSSIERNTKIFNRLSDEIDSLKSAITTEHPDFFDGDTAVVNSQNNVHLFGSLYQSIISPNFAKLLIYGEERFLSESENQERIRALLLAAVRAVILWRQVGGRRRFLVFRRKSIIEYAQAHI